MNFDPRYRLFVVPVIHQFAYLRSLSCDLGMTTHTFRDTRYPGGYGTACLGVAIHAGDFVGPGVDLVAEFDRLYGARSRQECRIRPVAHHQPQKGDNGDYCCRPQYLQRWNNRDIHLRCTPTCHAQGFTEPITKLADRVGNVGIFCCSQVGVGHLVNHLVEVEVHFVDGRIFNP